MNCPKITAGSWINVEGSSCVVSQVFDAQNPLGDCEVVTAPTKPANRIVRWTKDHWQFSTNADLGGYAEKYPRLRKYVEILQNDQSRVTRCLK